VLAACQAHQIKVLVFTSSPSVTFDGRDQEGLAESAPYPAKFLTDYPRTKAAAEKLVLAANSPRLAVTALRPHLIWGPGDPHLVPRLLERARAGKLRVISGMDAKKVDSVYVDNAAYAHILAAEKLLKDGSKAACAGKPYFITNFEPLSMRELINGILQAGGLPPVTQTISPGLAYFAGALLETSYRLLGKKEEPPLTRFVARQLSTAHWFDPANARCDLGYEPAISHAEGLKRLAQALNPFSARIETSGKP
jgi:nucleoside-diphosphate-sugar epimerase